MSTLPASATLPVLEPLSKATETSLAPIELANDEYIFIDLDEEGKRFEVQVRCLTDASGYEADQYVTATGAKKAKSWRSPSFRAACSWCERIPERKELGYGWWLFGLTDFTALVIGHVWPEERIVFSSEDAELTFKMLLTRFLSQTIAAKKMANFKVNGIVPQLPSTYIQHPDLPQTPYQQTAFSCCLGQEAFALFMEQGTGKTNVVVNRVCHEGREKYNGRLKGRRKGMYRALIICPQQVRLNWQTEFRRFATTPGKTVVLRGDVIRRIKNMTDGVKVQSGCEWGVCIMSVDSVDSIFEALSKLRWDLVVWDESHFGKNPQAKRTKICAKLKEFSYARMILTGTPIANTMFDLWAQLEFLGDGLSGFSTFKNFRSFHGEFENRKSAGGSAIQKLIGMKGVPLLQERLARLAFMLRKSEAKLNLPDKVYSLYEVEMTGPQKKLYSEIATQIEVEIEEMLEKDIDNPSITVSHILTKLLRLAQVTSGHLKLDNEVDVENDAIIKQGEVVQIPGGNPKVDAIVDILKSEDRDPNGKTLIWCHFIEDIRAISARLAEEGIEHVGYHSVIDPEYRVSSAAEAEHEINHTDSCRVFIGNPASGGTGLNFLGYDRENPDKSEMYVDQEVFVSCSWNMVHRSQAEDRAHRRGTRSNVSIIDLVVPGTIDEEIRARVMAKQQKALMIQDVRDIMKKLVASRENL